MEKKEKTMDNKESELLQLEKEKMLINRNFAGEDELIKMEGFKKYITEWIKCVEANITKPKEYQCNNKLQENGFCEWEDESNACSSREITYWRVENMLHIVNYGGLTTLCEMNKQKADLLPVFLYCLNNLEELDKLYEGQSSHFGNIAFDSAIKAILYAKTYNILYQENNKNKMANKIIFYKAIHNLSYKLSEFDDLDIDVEIYNIDDTLRNLLQELTAEFETGATEDELIEKAINNKWINLLVDIEEIKQSVESTLK